MRRNNTRKLILVKKDVEMGRLARPEKPRVAIEVIVPFYGTDDMRVDDRARGAVPTAVGVEVGGGKEYYLVVLSDDDKCNRGLEA
jgi:hypothetical protein